MALPISTPNAPAALGPYSQAVRAGDTVYLSRSIPRPASWSRAASRRRFIRRFAT